MEKFSMSGKVIHEWISKAEQDRTASKTLIKNKRQTTYDVICFHCQQCIEKYLKSYKGKMFLRKRLKSYFTG
jgi:HEPN domain-containing protein